ncbi:MAG: PHP domain-containing protein [Thermotogota bacterium]|nr:PHP domain-containing protein [Thermotogota bacterium]
MLNIRSCYSIPKSVIKLDELAEKCAEYGLTYCSICDDNFFGLPELLKEAQKNNLKPVFGYRQTTEEGVFSFFIQTKDGYFSLIQFVNKTLTFSQLLDKSGLTVVFDGSREAYGELSEKYPCMYYAVDEKDEIEGIKNPVYFRAINVLTDDDVEALELIKKTGKIDLQESEEAVSLETSLKNRLDKSSKKIFTNMEKIVEGIQNFDLRVNYVIPLLGDEDNDENEQLYERCHSELVKRGLDTDSKYQQRFDAEYSVVSKKGFSRYLLLAADIVDTAKEIGAWVGPGRGSAVGSLLVYLLGITQADPIKTKLIFERFLSLDREDEPDIDIDVEDEMRQQLLSKLRKRYTGERMVNVITFGTYGEKLVKRELTKHFKIEQNQLAEEKYQHLMTKIIGLPHHVSTHAAGIIFSEHDLRELIPLREMSEDSLMSQYDMNSLKECGLVKMDILGLITLSTLKKTEISFESLDIQDSAVYKDINTNNLCGIFQLDSRTGRKLTEDFVPGNFDEIRMLISLNRPGPSQSGLTDELISRRNGSKKVEYYHPLVKEVLSDTWGVPVYQEQIMEMSMKLAGFTPKQANGLRKAMAKKDHAIMSQLKVTFIEGSMKNDLEKVAAEELFDMMAEFAGYAFNKAHATAYGLITYWTAYAKHHQPLQFYKIMIDSNRGKYAKLVRIINEARKNGIHVLTPDINKSDYETIIEDNGLRLGFNIIKDLNRLTVKKILTEREKDDYHSVEDFILRTDKSILSDFILKRLLEAHLFNDLSDKMALDDMIRVRDKNSKTLEKIGARLFGEATKNETKDIQEQTQMDKRNVCGYLQEEMQSYGFLVNIEEVFGLHFLPFFNSELEMGLITKELKANRYEVNNGEDYVIVNPNTRLKEGDAIVYQRHRNEAYFRGYLDVDHQNMIIDQKYLSEFEKTFYEYKSYLRESGIRKIKIGARKYNLEVLL